MSTPMMANKRWLWLPAVVVFSLVAITQAALAGQTDRPATHPLPVIDLELGSKAMVVQLQMSGPGSATMLDADVVFGRARGSAGEAPLLDIQVHDDKNGLAQRFNAWDPRWVEATGATPGEMSMLHLPEGIGSLVFPFKPNLKTLTVYNTFENQPVASFDLGPAIREFCVAHPTDADCRTDLRLSKSDSQDPAVAGRNVTYTLTVTNDGPNPAHAAQAVDILPAGLSFVSGSTGCGATGQVIICDLGAIPAGDSRTVTVTALIDAALVYQAGGPVTVTNAAKAQNAAGDDTDLSDNTDTEDTQVVAVADVKISFVAPGAPYEVLIGAPAAAPSGIVLANGGPSSPIDTVLSWAASTTTGLNINPSGSSVPVPTLSVGTPRAVNDLFTLQCTTPGLKTVFLAYSVSLKNSVDTDPDLTNNNGAASFQVDCVVPIAINIRPQGVPNSINLNTDATLAALTTSAGEYSLPLAFDAATINIDTVLFGVRANLFNAAAQSGATEIHGRNHLQRSYELDEHTRDADLDGVMHFKPPESGLTLTTTEGCLKGRFTTSEGTFTFFGCDSVNVVG